MGFSAGTVAVGSMAETGVSTPLTGLATGLASRAAFEVSPEAGLETGSETEPSAMAGRRSVCLLTCVTPSVGDA
jgi:hypothetical protein